MKRQMFLLVFFCLILSACGGGGSAPAQIDISGKWNGTFFNERNTYAVTFIVVQSGNNITGTYSSTSGGSGHIQGKIEGANLTFTLTQTNVCTGTYTGNAVVKNNTITFSGSGSDCIGVYNGGGTVTKITDAWVKLSAVVIPQNDGKETWDVDAFQNTCSDGRLEPFFRHEAKITITATLAGPDIRVWPPGIIYIKDYAIDYVRSDNSVGAPPIEQYHQYTSAQIIIPPAWSTGSTTVTFEGMFVDFPRKVRYVEDYKSGEFQFSDFPKGLNNYTAVYTFHGEDEYGEKFSFQASVPFVMGDFDNCSG